MQRTRMGTSPESIHGGGCREPFPGAGARRRFRGVQPPNQQPLTGAFRELEEIPPTAPLAGKARSRSFRAVPAVVANGSPTEIALPCNLDVFLLQIGLPPRSVVVELNGEPVAPSEFGTRPLADGDRLEIVRIVAGG